MRTVWLADDDEDDRMLFHEAMRSVAENVEVVSAGSGCELLENLQAKTSPPDMIFLDINMPLMNGIETLRRLKNDIRLHRFPVVVISTSSDENTIDLMFLNGADYYIVKPNTYSQLGQLLYKALLHPWIGKKARLRDEFVLNQ